MINYKELTKKIMELISKAYKNYGGYDTNDLNDIIIGMISDHIFTTKDSIQNLIYDLEKMRDYY
jgi:hypothetical protein